MPPPPCKQTSSRSSSPSPHMASLRMCLEIEMATENQIRASRANGAQSRGPVTPGGKARSSKNALRHGLLTDTVVLDNENRSAFTELLLALEAEFEPATENQRWKWSGHSRALLAI